METKLVKYDDCTYVLVVSMGCLLQLLYHFYYLQSLCEHINDLKFVSGPQ